jgi:ParB family chromosome partitioning protein
VDNLTSSEGAELVFIPIEMISRSPFQPRSHFDPVKLRELADSIDEGTLIQPVVVRRRKDVKDMSYELVAGERRWRAHQLLERDTIQCLVRDLNDDDARVACIAENVQRDDLNVVEEALGYKDLSDLGNTHDEIAKMVSKSRSHVTSTLRVLSLPGELIEYLREGRLDLGHVKLLASLKPFQQLNLGRNAALMGWSVTMLSSKARAAVSISASDLSAKTQVGLDQARLETRLSDYLASPVTVKSRRGKGGDLIISYNDPEVLEGILQKMGLPRED